MNERDGKTMIMDDDSCHILTAVVVNDDPTQLGVLSALVRKAGLNPLAFTRAEDALEAMTRVGPPDLIVTDLYMPGLDGWRLCRLLRSSQYAAFNSVPILVVSATYASDEATRIAADLGAEGFLPCPVDGHLFCEQVAAILHGGRGLSHLRVLIVEDSRVQAELLKHAFSAEGYEVDTAVTVQAAVEHFSRATYNVAVIDYHLPDGLGDGLLDRFLAAQPDCVCLMMTTDPGPELALAWMTRGAAAYLHKPFDAPYLIELCARARRERALLRVQDILEVRSRELRETNARHAAMIANVGDVIAILGVGGSVKYVSPNSERWFGWTPGDLVDTDGFGTVHPDDVERAQQELYALIRQENASTTLEYQYRCKDETYRWIEMTAVNRIDDPAINGVLLNYHDISERKEAELTLSESEARFKALHEASFGGIAIHDKGTIVECNRGLTEMTGHSVRELIGMDGLLLVAEASRDDVTARILSGRESPYEAVGLRKNGGEYPIRVAARSVPYKGKTLRMVEFRDITEQKEAAFALAAEKERLDVTLRSIGDGVITTDTDGRIVMLNRAAEAMTGWTSTEAAGLPSSEVFHVINERTRERCENPVEKVLATGGIVALENHTCLVAKDGLEITIADSGAPIHDNEDRTVGVVLVFRDMTEKQKLEDAMQREQKLESLGVLAGGIAHDFNNLLGGIFSNVGMALDVATQPAVRELLTQALGVMEPARGLTRQLLTFAKGGEPVRKLAPLFPVVSDAATLALSGSRSRLVCDVSDEIMHCEYDATQISQVITNIIINADQSMPRGGTISLKAESVMLDRTSGPDMAAGPYVKISIHDEGVGIAAGILPNVFDPFFTTKQKGSGLGLAMAYSIARKHVGMLSVESEPGKGTSFHMLLPASTRRAAPIASPLRSAPPRGEGTVLVMDDEKFLRRAVGKLLKRLGYTPVEAQDGREVSEKLRESLAAGIVPVAAILDLTVPGGMGGKEAADLMRKLDPTLPLIAASGYADDPIIAYPEQHGFTASIEKPFRNEALSDILACTARTTASCMRAVGG